VDTQICAQPQAPQAPEMLRPTGRWATQAELTKTFEDRRKARMDYIRTANDDLRDHLFDHPAWSASLTVSP